MSQTPGNDNRPVAGPETPPSPPPRKATKIDFEEAKAEITEAMMGAAEKLLLAGYTEKQIEERLTLLLMNAAHKAFGEKK